MQWGLFLNGRVRHNKEDHTVLGVDHVGFCSISVKKLTREAEPWWLNDTQMLDCIPILRPLSNITDEEKKEFGDKFKCSVEKFWVEDDVVKVKVLKTNTGRIGASEMEKLYDSCFLPATGICTVKELLWLMERRFFVGQCKLSECILEVL